MMIVPPALPITSTRGDMTGPIFGGAPSSPIAAMTSPLMRSTATCGLVPSATASDRVSVRSYARRSPAVGRPYAAGWRKFANAAS